jgi:very-short-patch-repair endonuclease
MLDRARQLRREMTLPERLLWREIRGRQLGRRFRRQVPMDRYVVDFYCPEAKLIVEVDGEFHGERYEEDARRTARLERRGYRVLRFQAIEILVDLDAVLETLLNEVTPPPALRATSPANPGSPRNRGGGVRISWGGTGEGPKKP